MSPSAVRSAAIVYGFSGHTAIFGAYRQFGEIALLGDTFDDRSLDASNWWRPNPNLPQAIDDSTVYSASGRLTAQLDQHNKVTAYYDRPFRRSTSTNPASPAYSPSQTVYYTAQAKWTSTVSNHLFVEAGFARPNYTRTQDYADPALRPEPNTTEWYANAPHIDLVTDRYWKETSQLEGRRGVFPVRNVLAGSASYVTGSHTAKVGAQFTNGYYGETRSFNGDLVQRYRSGVADSVTVYKHSGDLLQFRLWRSRTVRSGFMDDPPPEFEWWRSIRSVCVADRPDVGGGGPFHAIPA